MIQLPGCDLCGVLAIGRCAQCGRAFCSSHRWRPYYDRCLACAPVVERPSAAKQEASKDRIASAHREFSKFLVEMSSRGFPGTRGYFTGWSGPITRAESKRWAAAQKVAVGRHSAQLSGLRDSQARKTARSEGPDEAIDAIMRARRKGHPDIECWVLGRVFDSMGGSRTSEQLLLATTGVFFVTRTQATAVPAEADHRNAAIPALRTIASRYGVALSDSPA